MPEACGADLSALGGMLDGCGRRRGLSRLSGWQREQSRDEDPGERRIVLNELNATRKLKSALDQSQPIGERIRAAANAASVLSQVESDQIRLRQLKHEG